MFGAIAEIGGKMYDEWIGDRQDRLHYEDFQQKLLQNQVLWRVQDAQRAGINPLAALGVPPASAQPINTGGNFNGIGSAIDQAILAKEDAELRHLQRKEIQARIDYTNASTKNLEGKGHEIGANHPTGGTDPDVGIVRKPAEVIARQTPDLQKGTHAMNRSVSDFDSVLKLPDEDMGDLLESYLPARLQKTWNDAKRVYIYSNLANDIYRDPNNPNNRHYLDMMIAEKRGIEKDLPKGVQVVWDGIEGWKRTDSANYRLYKSPKMNPFKTRRKEIRAQEQRTQKLKRIFKYEKSRRRDQLPIRKKW